MNRLIMAILAVAAYILPASSKDRLIFTCISQEEGLTFTVNSIYKEKDGDVWMGCPSGLYQFNGHTLHKREDPQLNERKIYQVMGDSKDCIWALTDNWLLRRRDIEEQFSLVRIPEIDQKLPFYSMCLDETGIWFGSYGKIFRYTYKDDRFFLFCETTGYKGFDVRSMHNFDGNTLLCSSHNGLILIDKQSGEVREAPYGSRKEISALLIDSRDRIWLASYNNGIEVHEKDGTLIRRYDTGCSGLSNNIVLCMTEKDSTVWAGTDGGGINIIDLEKESIDVLSHVSGDVSSFPAHSIKSIYTDHDGNIWAGSVRNGLIRVSRSDIITYNDCHIGLNSGLSNPTVTCLFQDKGCSDKLWIGTDGEGMNLLDLETGEFTHWENTLKKKVVSIASYSDKELALSVYGDRILLFDRSNGRVRTLQINDEELIYHIKYSGRSVNLINEADGSLLLISNSVWRLDKESGRCIKIDVERKAKPNIFLIGHTEEGTWFHDSDGIYLLPVGGGSFQTKGNLADHTIRCGDIGEGNTIWLATSGGLQTFDMGKGTFGHVSTTLFNGATVVACDRQSRVWIGTEDAMFAYLIKSDSFALFGESDGVMANEYLSKPHLLSGNGDIFIGGVRGLLHIRSDFSTETTEIPKLKLYDIAIDNVRTEIDMNGSLKVPRNSRTARISISAHERDIFRNRLYRFTLGNRLTYETPLPVLDLKQLPPPGRYEILVSCTKRDGEWSEPARIMTMRIPQPWFLSWWFLLSMGILLVLTVKSIIVGQSRRKENELKIALKEQEQRLYEEKVALLINMSHELRTPLTLIMAPLKRMLGSMGAEHADFSILNRIYRQSRRMKDLLNMALDLRKMEVGKSSMKMENCNFNEWLTGVTQDIVTEGQAEGVAVIRELDPALTAVDFDKVKCETIMVNILMNAIKHSVKGDTITIRTKLTDEGMVRVSVSDQGTGLRDIDPAQMFTRFYQSNNEQYGSGIGLSYSKILVELHGGSIGAFDNPDRGATFWWEIPAVASAFVSAIPSRAYLNEIMGYADGEASTPEEEYFNTAGMTLMLVDDNQDLLEFLREALSGEFTEILTATGGKKVMAMLAEGHVPDIIVSDINMPEGDGYTLCKTLKNSERYSHIPVVLLTARGEEESQSDSYRIGAEGYMAKPFEVDTLLELLRSILRRKAEIRKKYLDTNNEDAAAFTSKEEDFILRLNKLIGENIGNPDLDQQFICRELGVSRALLYNRMKAVTGAGAKEYITKIRLEKAKSLIESTDLTIAEISEMTGFSTQSYFSTAFKGYTGKTPSQYKAAARG